MAVRLVRRARLHALLDRYAAAPLNYTEVGATLGEVPEGYRHLGRVTFL
jgi:hypothetical protein